MTQILYSLMEAGKSVLFKDATGTPVTSPIVASQTDTAIIPHVTARWFVVTNVATSTGVVTVKIGTSSTPLGGGYELGPGDKIRLSCGSVNRTFTSSTAYPNRFFITTAAATRASFAFEVDSPDGT